MRILSLTSQSVAEDLYTIHEESYQRLSFISAQYFHQNPIRACNGFTVCKVEKSSHLIGDYSLDTQSTHLTPPVYC